MVYSVSNHYEKAKNHVDRKKAVRKQHQASQQPIQDEGAQAAVTASRGEKMGTSRPEIEVVREQQNL